MTKPTLPASVRRRKNDPGHLLEDILDTPELPAAIARLQPEVLHQIIHSCGLEECGALVAMATPAQLAAVFDIDLWHSPRPGVDEAFDAERFSVWLDVLLEPGEAIAAQTIAGIDAGVVTVALAQYVDVFDRTASLRAAPVDDDDPVSPPEVRRSTEIGGYRVVARRHDTWDNTVALLRALDAGHQAYFHGVMMACRRLSSANGEVDGLDRLLPDTAQFMFNRTVEREERREQHGYATPAQAAAFLLMSRTLPRGPRSTPPPVNPIASAYFRAMEWTDEAAASSTAGAPSPGVAAIVRLLVNAGALPERPSARLEGPEGSSSGAARIRALLAFARQHDAAAYVQRTQELGYLANVLIAGCSIQTRAFTPHEAFEAAVAVCNLGLENWPRHWLVKPRSAASRLDDGTTLPEAFLVQHDLVGVFQVGWSTLHEKFCMFAATGLMDELRSVHFEDREVQAGLKALAKDLTTHSRAGMPWRARRSFDVIATLDMLTCAGLLGLIDECPTLHGAVAAAAQTRVLSISSTAFEFISENAQLVPVRAFVASLRERLK